MFLTLLFLFFTAPTLSVDDSGRAIALQSPTHYAGPVFSTREVLFAPDGRTRLTVFASNIAGSEAQTFIKLTDHFNREFWLQPHVSPLNNSPYHSLTFPLDFGYDNGTMKVQVAIGTGSTVELSNTGTIQITNSTANALVICDGNSLTAGSGAPNPSTESYPAQLQAQLSGAGLSYTVVNFGVPGARTDDMAADAASQIDPLFSASRPRNVLIAWEIGNEVTLNIKTPERAVNDFIAYCLARRQAGYDVIVLNLARRADIPESVRAESNQRLAQAAVINNLKIVDLSTDNCLNSVNTTPCRHPDQVHFWPEGYRVIAEKVKAVLLQN